jgi:hypothetical protein
MNWITAGFAEFAGDDRRDTLLAPDTFLTDQLGQSHRKPHRNGCLPWTGMIVLSSGNEIEQMFTCSIAARVPRTAGSLQSLNENGMGQSS